eukprot:scaffold7341_cov229-Pinguiococcus_pyrenoidosus.AAC.9
MSLKASAKRPKRTISIGVEGFHQVVQLCFRHVQAKLLQRPSELVPRDLAASIPVKACEEVLEVGPFALETASDLALHGILQIPEVLVDPLRSRRLFGEAGDVHELDVADLAVSIFVKGINDPSDVVRAEMTPACVA